MDRPKSVGCGSLGETDVLLRCRQVASAHQRLTRGRRNPSPLQKVYETQPKYEIVGIYIWAEGEKTDTATIHFCRITVGKYHWSSLKDRTLTASGCVLAPRGKNLKSGRAQLDVTTRGPREPEVVIVAGVHGDETSGVRAVRRLREAALDLNRGVAFVIVNPDAVKAGKRYLDSDLNRAFPGDPAGDHEEQLAAQLCELIQDRTTLSLHGTHSQPTPFALVHRSQPRQFDLAAQLPVPHVVDHWGVNEGAITSCGLSVEVEVGPQGTEEAAVAAENQAYAFLKLVDALPGEAPTADPDFFHMADPIRKPPGSSYEVHVENFESIPARTAYASVDGRELITDDPFHPILMSADGYSDIFGYRGTKIAESLERVQETLLKTERG